MTDHQPFQWSSTSRSDVGNIRKINEDACLAESRKGIWAVADGMGGIMPVTLQVKQLFRC